jgi:hypothetical protein
MNAMLILVLCLSAPRFWASAKGVLASSSLHNPSELRGRPMRTQLIASLVVFTASPAFADYYLAQDPTTKQCKVVDAKPDGITMLMVGKSSYDLRSLAFMAAGNDYKDVCKGPTTEVPSKPF